MKQSEMSNSEVIAFFFKGLILKFDTLENVSMSISIPLKRKFSAPKLSKIAGCWMLPQLGPKKNTPEKDKRYKIVL